MTIDLIITVTGWLLSSAGNLSSQAPSPHKSLHLWLQKMIYKISHELGTLDDYEITDSSARMRLLIDGLNPITKEMVIDFVYGEESLLTLDYEGLKNHCTLCYRLSHLAADCPEWPPLSEGASTERRSLQHPSMEITPRHQEKSVYDGNMEQPRSHQTRSPARKSPTGYPLPPAAPKPYSQRLDRHGRRFGDRVSLSSNPAQPLKNKITAEIVPRSSNTDSVRRKDYHSRPLPIVGPSSQRSRREDRSKERPQDYNSFGRVVRRRREQRRSPLTAPCLSLL